MARQDDAARITSLERHARWLLRMYPAAYRRERGEEIVGTLLEDTHDGRTWPRGRDIRALATGGLKARAAQNRQRTVGANLRAPVMAGLALYLSLGVASYLAGVVTEPVPSYAQLSGWASWPAAVAALLTAATIVLAWTAPRGVVLIAALAASAAIVYFGLVVAGPHALLSARLLELLSLAGLVALAPRSGHPSRRWLWLPGIIVILLSLEPLLNYGWLGYTWVTSGGLPLLIVAVGSLLWMAVDARPMVAILVFLAISGLQLPVAEISSGYPFGAVASLPLLGVLAGIAALAVWLLRRQSANRITAD